MVGATFDAVTTIVFMRKYGADAELHPVICLMAHILGPVAGPVLGKIGQVIFVVFVASLWRRWCRWLILLCGALYLLASVSNHFEWL